MTERFLRLEAVRTLTGLSRSSIYAYMAAGTFPGAVKIGARSIAWNSEEVLEWMEGRIGAHRKAQKSEGAVSYGK